MLSKHDLQEDPRASSWGGGGGLGGLRGFRGFGGFRGKSRLRAYAACHEDRPEVRCFKILLLVLTLLYTTEPNEVCSHYTG